MKLIVSLTRTKWNQFDKKKAAESFPHSFLFLQWKEIGKEQFALAILSTLFGGVLLFIPAI